MPRWLQIYAIIIKPILPVYGEIRVDRPSHYEIEHWAFHTIFMEFRKKNVLVENLRGKWYKREHRLRETNRKKSDKVIGNVYHCFSNRQ